MGRPLPLRQERQVEAVVRGPDGESTQRFDMPDELAALRFVDLLRATTYCKSARLIPLDVAA